MTSFILCYLYKWYIKFNHRSWRRDKSRDVFHQKTKADEWCATITDTRTLGLVLKIWSKHVIIISTFCFIQITTELRVVHFHMFNAWSNLEMLQIWVTVNWITFLLFELTMHGMLQEGKCELFTGTAIRTMMNELSHPIVPQSCSPQHSSLPAITRVPDHTGWGQKSI